MMLLITSAFALSPGQTRGAAGHVWRGRTTVSLPRAAVVRCYVPPGNEEPELDERQAALMKAQGFKWDSERRRWFRGDPSSRVRRAAECRSSSRTARFVDASTGEAAACGEAVSEATKRLEKILQDARDEALEVDEGTRASDLRIKDKLAAPWAPYAWAVAQLAIGGALYQAASIDWGATAALGELRWSEAAPLPAAGDTLRTVAIGLACAPPLILAQRRQRACHSGAGVEGSSGQARRCTHTQLF